MNSELKNKLGEIKKKLPLNLSGTKNDICFFCDCFDNSIKSHSISKKKILSLLEGKMEKGRIGIYYLDDVPDVDFKDEETISTYKKINRRLLDKGKDNVSIFYGFCSDCDRETFNQLDNNNYNNITEINFLHSLRTQAYQLTIERNTYRHFKYNTAPILQKADKEITALKTIFLEPLNTALNKIPDTKNVNWDDVQEIIGLIGQSAIPIKNIRDQTEELQKNSLKYLSTPSNYPMTGLTYKTEIKKVLYVFKEALDISNTGVFEENINKQIERVENEIKKLTQIYRSQHFEYLSYLCVPINGIFLIAGAFTYNISNKNHITLTFFPEKETNKTYFIFSEDKVSDVNSVYLSVLNNMCEEDFKLEISNIIFSTSTNVFLSPVYYEKLPLEIRKTLLGDKTDIRKIGLNLFSNKYKE